MAKTTDVLMRLAFASALAPRRTLAKLLLALTIAVGAWTYAGYAIGLAKGKGWRGAVIEGRCVVVCQDGTVAR
jgi:hypothetical protein